MPDTKASSDIAVDRATRFAAGTTVLTYATLAALWILVSDYVVAWMFQDPGLIARASTLKGWLFVGVTTVLLYRLIRRLQQQIGATLQQELRVRDEQAQLRQLLNSIVEGASDAIFAKDLEGRYLLCNTESARVTGLTVAQMLGQKEAAVFPEQSESIRQNDVRVLQEGVTLTFEETVSTIDGERTYLSTKGPLRSADGRIYGLFGLAHDITERKRMENTLFESEARLQTLIRSIPDLVWLKDLQGVYLACNPQFEKFFGAKEKDILGKSDYDFVDKELADFFRANDQKAMDKEGPSVNEEWVTFASDGRRALLETTKVALRAQDGKIIGVLGIGHDITERYQLHESVERSRIRLQTILKTSSDGIHILDAEGTLVEANDAFLDMLGLSKSDIGAMRVTDWDAQLSWDEIKKFNDGLVKTQGKTLFETRHRRRDGSIIDVEISASGIEIDGKGYLYAASRDISLRKQMQSALVESEKRYRTILEWAPDPIVVQRNGRLLYLNPAAVKLFGAASEEELRQTPVIALVHPDSRERSLQRSRRLDEGAQVNPLIEQRYLKLDGTSIDVEVQSRWIQFDGAPAVLVAIRDVTERKAASQKIEHLAFYDPLTNLPNRRLMLDRLDQALIGCARQECQGALMMIDLDNFKLLNDTLGHATGDRLLTEVACRLRNSIREGDTVARMGGDEFIVILKDLGDNELAAVQAEQVANKILSSLGQAYLLHTGEGPNAASDRAYYCTSSIGIAMFKDHSVSVNDLLRRADTAMYQAKAGGKNMLRFFDIEMQTLVTQRAAVEVELRTAIKEGQLVLHYQPQVDSAGQVTGSEALVRWQHPSRGLLGPGSFIALAEESGLIVPLGQWVLDAACLQLAKWSTNPLLSALTLAVNVSARQFAQSAFVEVVLEIVNRHAIAPGRLKLELTESLLLENTESVIQKMSQLRARGIMFSLDDFGTGYSSLSYLKRLPLDQLKIDQTFIRDVLTDPNDAAIARTVVTLGRSLGLNVIAEGVETLEQREWLIRNGCFVFQGYFYSRPVTAPAFEAYVMRGGQSDASA
ncbi:PAS domain S-box protein [Rhodoferax sp. GW822-FHT02A01]|uniref:PAS domain S-box protein n=1 Tax=Rhodoferax sp. GW822-FHT02A01 TaxID=3141537 RepID=UPI00315C57C6